MPMEEALTRVHDILLAGMTTGRSQEPYYIKAWYVDDPLEFTVKDLPVAVIRPGDTRREEQYVQEDTEVDPVTVYFFPRAVRRAQAVGIPNQQSRAMITRAIALIRQDPTLGNVFYDAQVLSLKSST